MSTYTYAHYYGDTRVAVDDVEHNPVTGDPRVSISIGETHLFIDLATASELGNQIEDSLVKYYEAKSLAEYDSKREAQDA